MDSGQLCVLSQLLGDLGETLFHKFKELFLQHDKTLKNQTFGMQPLLFLLLR